MRISDCHEGLCKPGIDQVGEPGQEADFVFVPTRQYCKWAFNPDHEHVALDEREWCIDHSFPPGTKGYQIEVYSV